MITFVDIYCERLRICVSKLHLYHFLSKNDRHNIKYTMFKIIALVGRANTGKSTVAKHLTKYGYQELSFASALKDYVSYKYGFDRDLIEGATEESRQWRETHIHESGLTPRQILQKVGIDKREKDPDYWIKKLNIEDDSKYVISDCRFENEITFVKSHKNSITMKLVRNNNPVKFEIENNIDDLVCDHEIIADSIEELISMVDEIIDPNNNHCKKNCYNCLHP